MNKNLFSKYFILLIMVAVIPNIIIFFWADDLISLVSSIGNEIEFMVFALTVILVDATLSLLSFTYILVIKDDRILDLDEDQELIKEKNANDIHKLVKNLQDEYNSKYIFLENRKKILIRHLDNVIIDSEKLIAENEKLRIETNEIRKIHEKSKKDLKLIKELESWENLPEYVIFSKLMKYNDMWDDVELNLRKIEKNVDQQEIKISEVEEYKEKIDNLEKELTNLKKELDKTLRLIEHSIEVYNFKNLKRIGKLFFQSSISIILGFFILGILLAVSNNIDVSNILRSFNNLLFQSILLVIVIFIVDGIWSFIKAVYYYFTLYIRD